MRRVQIAGVVLTPADKTPAEKPVPEVPPLVVPPPVEVDQEELTARRFARRALERDDANLADDYREFFARRKPRVESANPNDATPSV